MRQHRRLRAAGRSSGVLEHRHGRRRIADVILDRSRGPDDPAPEADLRRARHARIPTLTTEDEIHERPGPQRIQLAKAGHVHDGGKNVPRIRSRFG